MNYVDQLRRNLTLEPEEVLYRASVLALITHEDDPKLLLTRRASTLKSHAGQVSLPGGMRELHERSNAEAALRETHEEVGVPPESVELIGCLPTVRARSGKEVKPLVGLVQPNPQLILEEREVARAFWVPLSELLDAPVQPYHVRYYGVPLKTASFVLQDEVVWGLTGRVLVHLLDAGFGAKRQWSQVMKPWK